jgi:uncharacterized C2H2 Zn-finger protein
MSRVSKSISLPKRILILCEGESEQIYLKGIKKETHNKNALVEIEMYQPNDFSPLGLFKEAKKKIREANKEYPYYSIWIVFDKDDHKEINRTFNLAEQNRPIIEIAFSNISFEYWILLHFERTNRYFKNSEDLIRYIDRKHHFNYSKTMNIFEALKDNISIALSNATWLHQQNAFELMQAKPYSLNSYTNFDQLYSYLQNPMKKPGT